MTADPRPCETARRNYWFPASDRYDGPEAQYAKNLCGICPERAACLERALDFADEYGVFGGLDPDERKALLVAAGRPATPHEREVALRRAAVESLTRHGLPQRVIAGRLGVKHDMVQRDLKALGAA